MKELIRIGTRGSDLALYQAELTRTTILGLFPEIRVEIVAVKTSGDITSRRGANPFETKRVFTREIEEALLDMRVDIAVHSAKDLSVLLPEGTHLAAVLKREDPRDCLVASGFRKLADLPQTARIGTSALRRRMQLLRWKPDARIDEIHGNVGTRLRKLDSGEYDALVMAYAGLKRLGLEKRVSQIFPESEFYPAPAQGTIVIQSRSSDTDLEPVMKAVNDRESWDELVCERAFLRRLDGGCQLPCGMTTLRKDDGWELRGALFDTESPEFVEHLHRAPLNRPVEAGVELADGLLAKGGAAILKRLRRSMEKKTGGEVST